MDAAEQDKAWLEAARAAMEAEAEGIVLAARALDDQLVRAVRLILEHPGKVVVTGMGKSGHVARKVAATFCSTGTQAVFLHPAEAVHGDLGVYSPGDPTIMISKSGSTAELLRLVPTLREFRSPIIGILGSLASPLASEVDVVLNASVRREADPNNLAPTASAVVALALGDAVAVALIVGRRVGAEEFGRLHPAGQLGANLRLAVRDVMHSGGEVAWARPEDSLKDVVVAMTMRPLGAACVVDGDGRFLGLITDGDLRRALRAHDDIRPLDARQVMTAHPVSVEPGATLAEALRLMEDRPSQISVLPVVEAPGGRCLGLVRLHDIYRSHAG
jgi:arabinose-5-phosphate isomerase